MSDSKNRLARLADMCRYALRVIESSPPAQAETAIDQVEQAWDLLTKAAEQIELQEDVDSGPVRIGGKRMPPPTVEFRAVA